MPLPASAVAGVLAVVSVLSPTVRADFTEPVLQHGAASYAQGAAAVQSRSAQAYQRQDTRKQSAKSVILFIADGNGVSSNYATRVWEGQQAGGFGDDHVLAHERMPHIALSKTYNINAQTPDSASTATALNSGVKTMTRVLGVDENARRGRCETLPGSIVTNFAESAKALGKRVGVVSTARITHATPASVYAHSVDRDFEAAVPDGCDTQTDIASQLIDELLSPTPLVDIALGGGLRNFLPTPAAGDPPTGGIREDGINLVQRFQEQGGAYASDRATFEALVLDGQAPVLGLFNLSHMDYEFDRAARPTPQPSILEMTAAAVRALTANNAEGYYLMVEGGRVDHANHDGNLYRTVTDGVAYQEAVQWAMDNTDPEEVLIVSTADHSHGLEFNGYCGRGSPIHGLCMGIDNNGVGHTGDPELGTDGLPYTVAGFMNGFGSVLAVGGPNEIVDGQRVPLTAERAEHPDYAQEAVVPLEREVHSATDVAVYARGPSAHLVDGTIEQNEIYHVMRHALTVDDAAARATYGFGPLASGEQGVEPTGWTVATACVAFVLGVGVSHCCSSSRRGRERVVDGYQSLEGEKGAP